MKDEILRLRSENKSYREIAEILNVPLQRVDYYCNENRKAVLAKARKKYAARNRLQKKVASFHGISKNKDESFTYREFLEKVGPNPSCYITKKPIDLSDIESYSIDHVIPNSKGGTNQIDNAELILTKVNKMKQDMTPDEFLEMCKTVLQANGYTVTKN